jgi:hypothetical protein
MIRHCRLGFVLSIGRTSLGNIQGKSMRPNQNNKRMRGRNNNNNNRKGPNPLSRSYESNGPDVKIRGTAHHIGEKYLQLARDAQSSGDPVMAESYLQHAEHYFRIIAAAQQAQQQAQLGNYDRPAGEAEDEDIDEDDDFNGLSDRFASPAERSAPPQLQPQPQPQPYVAQPQGQAPQPTYNGPQGYQERPQYEPRGERNNRNFQDRNNYNDRNGQGHRESGHRDGNNGRGRYQGRSDAPRYDSGNPRAANEEVETPGLPAFITAPVPVRVQPEAQAAGEDEAVGTEVMARPEAEGEANFGLRPRRRRRKPEFGDSELNKTPDEE